MPTRSLSGRGGIIQTSTVQSDLSVELFAPDGAVSLMLSTLR
jgi:hypothetical protein